jgi:ParB family transcriptional regulator, chromosome partitioning protein
MKKGDNECEVRLATSRTYSMVRVDDIDVITSRARGREQFQDNVRSIAHNGLYKPIVVNARDHSKTNRYRLICGEGRLAAHRELKLEVIKAEIVNVDEATAHIMAIGENMTKCAPQVIEYAYALQEMHRKGSPMSDMERITGHSAAYIRSYIRLVDQGEDRLIKGVEQGIFTLEFAMKVAESKDGAIQHLLMDAFDQKLITARQVEAVRKILMARSRQGASLVKKSAASESRQDYTLTDLKRDITRLTKEKETFINGVEGKETRLFSLLEALRRVRASETILVLLKRHGFERLPELQGKYGT